MAAKRTFTATYGDVTETRTSARAYTHASVISWGDGTYAITFHTSEALAARGILTAQQRQNGAEIVTVLRTTES